ncbi:MAG: hypothetical protein ACOYB4_02020 [Methyloceanibacter sp.]
MHNWLRLLSVALFAVLAGTAAAQETVTTTYNGTTLSVGGGVQFLTLPDIRFTGTTRNPANPSSVQRQRNSDFAEYGWATGGGIETALGFWGDHRVTGAIKGFFANADDHRNTTCQSNCAAIAPTGDTGATTPGVLFTNTERDVDYWGAQLEFKFARAEPVRIRPNVYRNDYFLIGADIRGIDQDNELNGRFGRGAFTPDQSNRPVFNYKETLDTTYYGGYIGFGGEYSLGFLGAAGVTNILDSLGLRSFIAARGGLYSAETDYDGLFSILGPWRNLAPLQGLPVDTRLKKSNSELAFIGSISFETRKQIGSRSSLSLWTDYEYISSVPEMHYAGFEDGTVTRIKEGDAFASRTMLRLNIGLGPTQLYDEPLR